MITEFISAALQVGLFTLIPYLFYRFSRRRTGTFRESIGLTMAPGVSILYGIAASIIFLAAGIGLAFLSEEFRQLLFDPNSVTGKLRASGLSASGVMTLLITAWIKTSLSEEIFFRGFIAKRMVARFGFSSGNIVQASIFGAIHFLLFMSLTGASLLPLFLILSFSTLAGWTIGLIKEKYANGSILPGWVAHGFGNMVSYAVVAYAM